MFEPPRSVLAAHLSCSLEIEEAHSIARALGAEVVTQIPPEGDLVAFLDTDSSLDPGAWIELGARKLERGLRNFFVINSTGDFESAESWRPVFQVMGRIAERVFVRHPFQLPFVRRFGIDPVLLPFGVAPRVTACAAEPQSLLCVLPRDADSSCRGLVAAVAEWLPGWRVEIADAAPEAAIRFSQFDRIWILPPRCERLEASLIGLHAVLSGGAVVLPGIGHNRLLETVAHAYPRDAGGEEIARRILGATPPPLDRLDAVRRAADPDSVASRIMTREVGGDVVIPRVEPEPVPVLSGLRVHLDAADPASYDGCGLLWKDLCGNHDAELPGECGHPRADPQWTGKSFRFKGQNFMRLLKSQDGFFKTFCNRGARFSLDCFFRTGSQIRNPHFLLADCAHGNPVDGCGFGFYFYFFEHERLEDRACMRFSLQNNAKTPLCRSVHCSHPALLQPDTYYRAAVSFDSDTGRGVSILNEHVERFDGTLVEPTERKSPYYVNIGAPGNIEFNAAEQWERHVSSLDFSTESHEARMRTPYGRMRFHPGFEMFAMLIYDRALTDEELVQNGEHLRYRFDGISGEIARPREALASVGSRT